MYKAAQLFVVSYVLKQVMELQQSVLKEAFKYELYCSELSCIEIRSWMS